MKILTEEVLKNLNAAIDAAIADCNKSAKRVQAHTLKKHLSDAKALLKKFDLLPEIQQPAPKQEPAELPRQIKQDQPKEEERIEVEYTPRTPVIQEEVLTQQPATKKRRAPKKINNGRV